ncbi:MAG: hypothetical protein CM15mP74_26830 [Halieaceae bacterium]|nr:MAG: hypothetical protein CM15mP74_26830 [Halieaceae bacterium]
MRRASIGGRNYLLHDVVRIALGDHRLPDPHSQPDHGGLLLPPSTTNAGPYFRTIPLLPEGGGRVEDVFVKNGESVEAGDPLFSLLDTAQVAGVNIAESQLDQIASAFAQAEVQLGQLKPPLYKLRARWRNQKTSCPKTGALFTRTAVGQQNRN